MKTRHQIYFSDSRQMQPLNTESAQLVVTSPPYPMISMWDEAFSCMDKQIESELRADNGIGAFERMHRRLDPVWQEVWRILAPGGIACINVGDATRKVGSEFSLYPNHARILSQLMKVGFTPLPAILWRKPTNAPTKFMGSGMLPAGAYVTLEHEYILILRKGAKRDFESSREKQIRRQSAIFWEERNEWYSDVWLSIVGTGQNLNSRAARKRSAAFPFAIPYRLINMFSVKGDLVVDPFAGTGTTLKAAAVAARNSIGFDLDNGLRGSVFSGIDRLPTFANAVVAGRLQHHRDFVSKCASTDRRLKYLNKPYQIPVVTGQETDLFMNPMASAGMHSADVLEVRYLSEAEAHPTKNGFEQPTEPILTNPRQLSIFKS
jgi:DNA modification methylase